MRESKTLEFKKAVTNTFLKTVSAYANYDGGSVLFGVDDQGTEVGMPNPRQACLDIENKINDSIAPNPDYTLRVHPSTGVVELAVMPGLSKPYLYKAKAYKRNDTATIEVDRTELARLIMEGQNISFDQTPSRAQDASFNTLALWLENTVGVSAVTDDTLKTLELKRSDGVLTVAGELFADHNSFPGIDMVRFGESVNIFLDRETYERVCILEQYDRAVSMFQKYYCYEEIEGYTRKKKELIPESALREAIANALVHRLWDVPAHIRVAMHPDRIEVISPGGLVRGMTEEEYLNGWVSELRNPVVGNVFFRLRLIERFGTGVLRIKDAYRDSWTKPSFTVTPNSITVSLPLLSMGKDLTDDERAVLGCVQGRRLPVSEIAAAVGFGKTKTQTLLKSLREKGYVSITGVGRGTKYSA